MMLDGNTAALRSEEERQSFVDAVFARHESDAEQQLKQEAVAKFTVQGITLDDLFDHLCGGHRLQVEIELALANDDALQLLRMFQTARDEILEERRDAWIQDHLEDRVWDLHHGVDA